MPDVLFLADAPTEAPAGDPPTSRIAVARLGRFKHGRYGRFAVTRGEYENWRQVMASSFQGRIPLDVDHGPERGGSSEAAGWITALDENGKDGQSPTPNLIWATVEWTPLGVQLVNEKRYQYVSPVMHSQWADENGRKHGPAMLAVSLTNRPHFQSMPAVSLSRDDPSLELATDDDEPPPLSDSPPGMSEFANIAKALGLEDDATEMSILEAIKGQPLVKIADALQLDTETGEAKILEEISGLRTRLQKAEDGQLTKPLGELARDKGKKLLDQGEYDTLVAEARAGKQAVEDLKEKRFAEAFRVAVSEGRAAPTSENRFRSLYDSDPSETLNMLDELPRLVSTAARGSGGSVDDAPPGQEPERFLLDRRVRAHMRRHNETDYAKALDEVVAQDGDYS